ncbi:chaperonin GroEL [Patescibacteria group bacterium]|nr:chaperonin GroEL [Patescibacteria group bacterium]
MSKKIIYNETAIKALKNGVDKVANAVKITLGPRGRNVVLDKSYGGPTITNDGVTIAKEISLFDKFENMGAEIVKEVAEKTNSVAGDGTTTSVVLMQAIVDEGMRKITMGENSMEIRRGIETAALDTVKELKNMSKEIKNDDEIKQVAIIAAESKGLGEIIANTIKKVGKDGVVTVEESQSVGMSYDVVDGLEFDKGYVSPYMITNAERMESEYKDVPILLVDKKISAVKDILPILEKLSTAGEKDLIIIADDVEGEALATFVVNKIRGNFNILAIKSPGYGDKKKLMLEDISIVVGAQVVSEDTGIKLENIEIEMLGRIKKIISTKDKTIIIGGAGKKADIEKRVQQLKKQIQTAKSFEKEKLEERVAKLSGGVAVIHVGAATETEMKYLKLKIEDAVNATKAAIDEGIVVGGGVALIKVADKLKKKISTTEGEAFLSGYGILLKALESPLRQIVFNSGNEDGSAVLQEIRKGKGYDAFKNEIISDMISAGIIDPVKVTRSCVQNAASAAAILLTTEVAIADEPEKNKHEHNHGGDTGMGEY